MEKYSLFPAFLLEKIDANIALHKNWRQPVYTVEFKFMWRHFDLRYLYKIDCVILFIYILYTLHTYIFYKANIW